MQAKHSSIFSPVTADVSKNLQSNSSDNFLPLSSEIILPILSLLFPTKILLNSPLLFLLACLNQLGIALNEASSHTSYIKIIPSMEKIQKKITYLYLN